ncbi:MAG: DUF4012 domain-containing protein, partial [Candidatus Moraniibacteriota bacterium]
MTMKPFLTTVVILLIIALAGGYYWTTRMSDQADGLWGGELTGDLATLTQLASAFMNTGGEERVFLVLFQNNMELRPGGGFIGSFGILKVKDGSITDFSSNDVV